MLHFASIQPPFYHGIFFHHLFFELMRFLISITSSFQDFLATSIRLKFKSCLSGFVFNS